MGSENPPTPATIIRRTSSADGGRSGSIVLNKYELIHCLGRGSFAKVYFAKSLENTDVEVAIKVIDKGRNIATMEPQIVREVSAMRRLRRHPNILELHEVMATKSKIYLVMELAHGGDVFGKLKRRGRFSEHTAKKYFLQVVSALRFCHQNGVVHRDIKPHNLLLDRDGLLKVTDFGLSSLSEQKTNNLFHTFCGTPAYTAPEVFRHRGYDGEKADAWSCGVLLYNFLVGCLPFDDRDIPKMFVAMNRQQFNFPDHVSKSAKTMISKLMDPNPSTRLTLDGLIRLSWFKRRSTSLDLTGIESNHLVSPRANAFDIISMSPGLNLSGLFEAGFGRKVMRFNCGETKLGTIEERLVKTSENLGYRTGKAKGGELTLTKGRVVLTVEIWEIAVEMRLVEMKLVDGGAEFGDLQWEEMKIGLADIVLPSN